ncbi:hypothetical protein ACFQ88_22400 [Paenibacillus sp. NPDC056579]|uniref:hypothetical protein n=1 Tax=Paenibacillus sp. NPDC056579 TaxID=3345871 RepID=UPI0036B38882
MKNKLIVIILFLIIVSILVVNIGCSNNKEDNSSSINENISSLNKLVKASWVNTGTWVSIFCDQIADDDPDRGLIGELSGDKTMHRGTEKAKVIDEFITNVQKKYNAKIKVLSYKKDKKTFALYYEDGSSIIWDKVNMKSYSKEK